MLFPDKWRSIELSGKWRHSCSGLGNNLLHAKMGIGTSGLRWYRDIHVHTRRPALGGELLEETVALKMISILLMYFTYLHTACCSVAYALAIYLSHSYLSHCPIQSLILILDCTQLCVSSSSSNTSQEIGKTRTKKHIPFSTSTCTNLQFSQCLFGVDLYSWDVEPPLGRPLSESCQSSAILDMW